MKSHFYCDSCVGPTEFSETAKGDDIPYKCEYRDCERRATRKVIENA